MSDFHKISYFFFLLLRFILLKIILTVNQQGHFLLVRFSSRTFESVSFCYEDRISTLNQDELNLLNLGMSI